MERLKEGLNDKKLVIGEFKGLDNIADLLTKPVLEKIFENLNQVF